MGSYHGRPQGVPNGRLESGPGPASSCTGALVPSAPSERMPLAGVRGAPEALPETSQGNASKGVASPDHPDRR